MAKSCQTCTGNNHIAYWTLLCGFAWKLGAFKTQSDAFVESACGYLAHFILFRYAAKRAVGACAFLHSWTFFAGYSANTDFHTLSHRVIW